MLLDDLKAYLVAQSVAATGVIFLETLPPTPDACLALIEYGGAAPDFTLPATTGIATEHPRVQVLSRALTHVAARASAELAYKALAKVANQTLTATRYLRVEPLQSPFLLTVDANNRPVYAMNVETEKVAS
jgi:hypothetical protein